jgi:hypothetical protein
MSKEVTLLFVVLGLGYIFSGRGFEMDFKVVYTSAVELTTHRAHIRSAV